MKKSIILLLCSISLQSLALEIKSLDFKGLNFNLPTRLVNGNIIIDPTKDSSTLFIKGKKVEFKSKDLFLKSGRYKKHIFGKSGNHFIGLKLEIAPNNKYLAKLVYKDYEKQKTQEYKGLVILEEKANDIKLSSLR